MDVLNYIFPFFSANNNKIQCNIIGGLRQHIISSYLTINEYANEITLLKYDRTIESSKAQKYDWHNNNYVPSNLTPKNGMIFRDSLNHQVWLRVTYEGSITAFFETAYSTSQNLYFRGYYLRNEN